MTVDETYLTEAEVRRLTGRIYPSRQRAWLREKGYRFAVDADGRPVMLRSNALPQDRAASPGLLGASEIVRKATSITRIVGVYFLVRGSEIVYIGKSLHIMERIAAHVRKADKAFDAFYFIAVQKSQLDKTERAYIRAFQPRMNVVGNG